MQQVLSRGLCIFIDAVLPIVVAESASVLGIVGSNAALNFSLGDDAIPPVSFQNITVTFNEAPFSTTNHILLQLNGTVFTIVIGSLALVDDGAYTVNVETLAGKDSAETLLSVYG